jgi:hypothetical protein
MYWSRGEQIEQAIAISHELLKDIRKYFGHEQNELSILPNVIILHGMFSKYSDIPPTAANQAQRK